MTQNIAITLYVKLITCANANQANMNANIRNNRNKRNKYTPNLSVIEEEDTSQEDTSHEQPSQIQGGEEANSSSYNVEVHFQNDGTFLATGIINFDDGEGGDVIGEIDQTFNSYDDIVLWLNTQALYMYR